MINLRSGSILKIGSELGVSKAASIASPIAAIAVSVLIIIFVVWPKFSEVLRLRGANEQLAVRATSLEEKSSKLQSLDRDTLEQQLAAAEQLLPSDKGVFLLVGQLERAASASGVLLTRVEVAPGVINATGDKSAPPSPSPAVPSSSSGSGTADVAPKILVKASVGSDYKSFLQFLKNTLSVSRVISIKDLTVSSSGESNQLKINLTIEAYWQALPSELPSIESALADLTDSELARLREVSLTGLVSVPGVPSVPLGRSDLFAPF